MDGAPKIPVGSLGQWLASFDSLAKELCLLGAPQKGARAASDVKQAWLARAAAKVVSTPCQVRVEIQSDRVVDA